MKRSIMVLAASLALGGVVGCDNAMDEQKKATAAQIEANDKVAAATRESAKKAADAQLEADKKIAQAQADFMKMREDFRHNMTQSLVELDKKVDLLDAKAKHADGKAKIDLEEKMKKIHEQRATLKQRYDALESASATTWDDATTRINRQLSDLQMLVTAA